MSTANKVPSVLNLSLVKFRHLWAWDTMMRSTKWWRVHQQAIASQTNAPIDCIFKDEFGVWHTYAGITNADTKKWLDSIMSTLWPKHCAPAEEETKFTPLPPQLSVADFSIVLTGPGLKDINDEVMTEFCKEVDKLISNMEYHLQKWAWDNSININVDIREN